MIIKPHTIFKDFRGQYIETYNNKIYQKNSINIKFIQDDVSISKKNVLREYMVITKHGNWFLVFMGVFIL